MLLHGWSMNSKVWQPVLPLLEASFTVHCIDLPGHGMNTDCFPGDRLEDWVGAVIAVMPASSICVGWSLGGLLALAIARQQPDYVSRLGLVACSPRFTVGYEWAHAVPTDLLEDFSSGLDVSAGETLKRFVKLMALGDPRALQLSRRLQRVNRGGEMHMAALRAGLNFLRDEDLRHVFSGAVCPLWVALGDADRLVPVEAVSGLVRLNETVRIDVFENCGHIPFMSYPDFFVMRLQSWLEVR